MRRTRPGHPVHRLQQRLICARTAPVLCNLWPFGGQWRSRVLACFGAALCCIDRACPRPPNVPKTNFRAKFVSFSPSSLSLIM